jgi:hypothetical protein
MVCIQNLGPRISGATITFLGLGPEPARVGLHGREHGLGPRACPDEGRRAIRKFCPVIVHTAVVLTWTYWDSPYDMKDPNRDREWHSRMTRPPPVARLTGPSRGAVPLAIQIMRHRAIQTPLGIFHS